MHDLPPKLVLSSDWNAVGVLSFLSPGGCFQVGVRKGVQGSRSEKCTSEIVLSDFVSTDHFCVKVAKQNDATIRIFFTEE